jgi:hypothetical protein
MTTSSFANLQGLIPDPAFCAARSGNAPYISGIL